MDWLGAILVGLFVGLLGSGGSILSIPILVHVLGENEKAAIAESLAIVGLIAVATAIPYGRRHQISWRMVVIFGTPGMLGIYFGVSLSVFVSATLQMTLLSVTMLVAAIMMYEPTKWGSSEKNPAYWKIISEGLLVGILTGLVGVGGGFIIVPTLVLFGGISMRQAIGTSLVIIALKSAIGFPKYLDILEHFNVAVNVPIILRFSMLGMLGSIVGSQFAHRIPLSQLRKIFSTLLVLTSICVILAL